MNRTFWPIAASRSAAYQVPPIRNGDSPRANACHAWLSSMPLTPSLKYPACAQRVRVCAACVFSGVTQVAPLRPNASSVICSGATIWFCTVPKTCSAGHPSTLPSCSGVAPAALAVASAVSNSSHVPGTAMPSRCSSAGL
jgi:hypothetical protein